MDTRSLRAIHTRNLRAIQALGELEIDELDRPRVFKMTAATSDGNLVALSCSRKVSVDTDPQIRHGSELVLRNLKWLVTDEPVEEP